MDLSLVPLAKRTAGFLKKLEITVREGKGREGKAKIDWD